ncbi:MAG TPA: energy transducer TonB [Pyrinomonadaceae bacterium]|jgi:TonB family protein
MKKLVAALFSLLFFALLSVGAANAQTDNSANSTKEQGTVNQPLKIIRKTPPSIDSFRQCFETQGDSRLSIRVRVTFHSSGKVTDAEIVNTSGCEYFDKEAVRVAKKIKFEPEIKNGEAVTVTKSVEYKAGIR